MKKFFIFFLTAALLSGCSSARQFNPEQDTGYRLSEEEEEGITKAKIADTSALVASTAVPAGAAAYIAPPATIAGAAGGAALGAGMALGTIAMFGAYCYAAGCFGHRPYGDILLSGNVLRGTADFLFPAAPTEYSVHVLFPGWNQIGRNLVDADKIGLDGNDLVDVYFPHLPETEKTSVINRKSFFGVVVRVVCEDGDDECFDKYERDEHNFVLGRWKTAGEYFVAYEQNDGWPNKEN